MPGLTFTNNGKQWILCPNGSVSASVGTQETPNQGKWSTDLSANNIALTIGAQPSVSIPIKYSFSSDNQLVAVVPGGGTGGKGDSAAYTFQGRIDVNDNTEVRYTLLDANGQAVTDADGNPIVLLVHGDLSIDNTLNHLVLTFPDKTKTFITGTETDGSSVVPDQNVNASTGADADRLTFFAVTTNTYTAGNPQTVPANILFLGLWKLNEDGIYFHAAGTGTKQMSIQLGGTYKGVAAGISVLQVGSNTDVAFTIQGSHRFQSPSGSNTDLNWSVGLGYATNNQFDAIVKLGAASTPANAGGDSFQLNGTLQFASGSTNSFALELSGKYQARSDGQLVFTADITDGPNGIGYNLGLEGTYTVKGGSVKFDISVGGGQGGNTATVDLGYTSTDGVLSAHMKAVLKNNQVDYDFSLSMHFANGILVPAGPPVPLNPPTPTPVVASPTQAKPAAPVTPSPGLGKA